MLVVLPRTGGRWGFYSKAIVLNVPGATEASADRGATSTTGVILIVATTIILAGSIGLFVLNLGNDLPEAAPQASFDIESSYVGDGVPQNDSVRITHATGDKVRRERMRVLVGDDEVFNGSIIEDRGGSGAVGARLKGLRVEVDEDRFNDLNKPGPGPPGDADGDSRNVVNQWGERISAGDTLVIQERNDPRSYDVIQRGERVRVVWVGQDGRGYVIASARV